MVNLEQRKLKSLHVYIMFIEVFMTSRYFKVFDIKVEHDLLWSHILVGVLLN